MQLEVVPGIVPSVLATLGQGESVFAEHGIVLYKEDPVQVGRKNIHSKGLLSTLKRTTVGGLPFFMAEFTGLQLPTIQHMARAEAGTSLSAAQIQPVIDTCARLGAIKKSFPAQDLIDVNAR